MVTRWTEQKRRYRQYKARTEALPASSRTATDRVAGNAPQPKSERISR